MTAKLDAGGSVALSGSPSPVVSNLNGPGGLAVDAVQLRVWWTTADGLIESAGFDGAQREVLHTENPPRPLTSVDVFEDFVYTVIPSDNLLLKVNKFARQGKKTLSQPAHCLASEAFSPYCSFFITSPLPLNPLQRCSMRMSLSTRPSPSTSKVLLSGWFTL